MLSIANSVWTIIIQKHKVRFQPTTQCIWRVYKMYCLNMLYISLGFGAHFYALFLCFLLFLIFLVVRAVDDFFRMKINLKNYTKGTYNNII